MKICFLGPAQSVHIIKWCRWFLSHGHEIHVISFVPEEIEGAHVHWIDIGVDPDGGDFGKLKYLFTGKQIKRLLDEIEPDVVNAHYATSYGAAVALSGVKGYVLSVWGSDIYDFPQRSPFHKALLEYSLKKAAHLFSTSKAMADEAANYTKKTFSITPFGVDTALFSPDKRNRTDESFVIGTVKSLSYTYGIHHLIRAAASVRQCRPDIPLRLRIAGNGPDKERLEKLAEECGVSDIVTWLGFISQEEAAREWANMDLAVVFSEAESFGVSAVEAQSCCCPVITSDIPGLVEATNPGVTSVMLPKGDVNALTNTIISLYDDPEKRRTLGENGRKYVVENYEYQKCFCRIESLFSGMCGEH